MLNIKMKKQLVLVAGIISLFIHCSTTGFGPQGSVFTSTKIGIFGLNPVSSKSGSACVQSILGTIAFGDGSVSEATNKAGIAKVQSIDLEGFSVLGLYSRQCTIVKGE